MITIMSVYLPLFLSCSCVLTYGDLKRSGPQPYFDPIHWPRRGPCSGALTAECGISVRGYVVGLQEAVRGEYLSFLLVACSMLTCSEGMPLTRLVRGRMPMSFSTGERVPVLQPFRLLLG